MKIDSQILGGMLEAVMTNLLPLPKPNKQNEKNEDTEGIKLGVGDRTNKSYVQVVKGDSVRGKKIGTDNANGGH